MTGGRGVWYNSSRGRCSGAKCEGVLPPLYSPRCRRSALHPGDFLPDEKVTKESPRGLPPLGTPLGGHYHPPSNASVAPPRKRETLGSPQKPKPPAAPRIDSRECDPGVAWGEKRPICPPAQSGKSGWGGVVEGSPARCAASAKRAVRDGYSFQFNGFCVPSLEPDCVRFPKVFLNPRGIPKGAALGAPLVTFPATGKSPGVEGRSALLVGAGAKSADLLRGRSPHLGSAEGPHLWCTPRKGQGLQQGLWTRKEKRKKG